MNTSRPGKGSSQRTLIFAIILTMGAIVTGLFVLVSGASNTSYKSWSSILIATFTVLSIVFSLLSISSEKSLSDRFNTLFHALTATMPKPSRSSFLRLLLLAITIIGTATISVFFALVYFNIHYPPPIASLPHVPGSTCLPSNTPLSGPGTTKAPDGECIGVSDGSFVFDINRPDGKLKAQGAQALSTGNTQKALSSWREATNIDTNDAEILIYLEDQYVLASGNPYLTVAIGTTLSGLDAATGRDMLQGAYIAQKEANSSCSLAHCTQVRLIIANVGNDHALASLVAQQIVSIARHDPTFVGVIGWPLSIDSLYALQPLEAAHISMISPTASSDDLTGRSPYFFRIVPPDSTQGIIGADYASHVLHATRPAVLYDPSNLYSQTLAQAFTNSFVAQNAGIPNKVIYSSDNIQSLEKAAMIALNYKPDLIYFAGDSSDLDLFLAKFNTYFSSFSTTQRPYLQILGGDGLYDPNGYRQNLPTLRFTAFAYPDEWAFQGLYTPPFFPEYAHAFDPQIQHPGTYAYARPDSNAILAYDATQTLLQATKNVLATQGQNLTPFRTDSLRQALASIVVQGISGQISFGPDGNPRNKALVLLYVDSQNRTQLQAIYGQFLNINQRTKQ
jgi:ABC-type branched-subunit amino acid transport system substrate-binding protein